MAEAPDGSVQCRVLMTDGPSTRMDWPPSPKLWAVPGTLGIEPSPVKLPSQVPAVWALTFPSFPADEK